MADMLGAATEYAEAGYFVFPLWGVHADGSCRCGDGNCKDQGKHPIGWLVPKGLKEATDNVTLINHWWSKEPDANIGLRTGVTFFVLDFDVKDGVSCDERRHQFTEQFGALPETAEALTGGGGRHDLFAMPDGIRVRNQQNLLAGGARIQGIDVRGNDGYIVAPPSVHASGASYVWACDLFEHIKAAPPWLLDLVAGEVVESAPSAPMGSVPPAAAHPDAALVRAALAVIPPNTDRETWLERVTMPMHDMFHGSEEGFQVFLKWCKTATGKRTMTPNGNKAYAGEADCRKVWNSLHTRHRNPKGRATFFETAIAYGYTEEVPSGPDPSSTRVPDQFEWPETPQSLWTQDSEPELDLEAAFPAELRWLRDLISNIAKLQQVPAGFPALIALGMASGAVSKAFDITLDETDWTEPLSLWVMCAMSSGTGKSPVFRPLAQPFREFEKDQAKEFERQIAKWTAIKKRLMAVAVKAERAVGNGDSNPSMLDNLIAAEGALAAHDVDRPQSKGLLASSFTTPALIEFLMAHNERCLIIDPEGGVFEQVFKGRGDTDLDPWLKAFSCETIKQNRVGGRQGAIERYVDAPMLSMAIATQTEAMDVFQDSFAASKGFLARFIPAIFDHRLPTTAIINGKLPVELTARWREVMYGMLERDISEMTHLMLSGEARKVFVDWNQEWLNYGLADPQADKESSVGWGTASGAKLRSQALRLVGLFHVLADPDQAHDVPIAAALMRCVCEVWMPYIIANVKRTVIATRSDPDLLIAERVIRVLHRASGDGSIDLASFTRSELRDRLRDGNATGAATVQSVDDLNMALSHLCEAGYLWPIDKPTYRRNSVPASARYRAHPNLARFLG